MKDSKWLIHPIVILIISIAALVSSLFFYIYWYVGISSGLNKIVTTLNLNKNQVLDPQVVFVIVVLSILFAIIFMGIFLIFVYNQKTFQLYRMQNNFINNFTHELKTPVTSLKLYLETFEKHALPREEQLPYIHYMLKDTNRLSNHINSILNLARIESKNFRGEFVEVELYQFVENFLMTNQYLFESCEIHLSSSPAMYCIYAVDHSLFEILLMNIITNAIRYNQSEAPFLQILFSRHPGKIEIQFIDNGMGMKKSEPNKIFKKFYQIGKEERITANGSGLGLYMAQMIIKLHHGRLTATSPGPGKGSTFKITLPQKRSKFIDRDA